MYARLGDIRERTGATMWMCNYTPLRWTEACRIPTKEEIAADTSDYGPRLKPEYRKQAEQLAQKAIQEDVLLCELDNSCPFDWRDPRTWGQAGDALKKKLEPDINGGLLFLGAATVLFLLSRR